MAMMGDEIVEVVSVRLTLWFVLVLRSSFFPGREAMGGGAV